jgi:hypothetical protein
MNPVGFFVLPATNFPKKQNGAGKNSPDGTVPMISDSGFTNKEIFIEGEADKWMHNYPRLGIPRSEICLICRNAYENIANMNMAKETFQVTGLPYVEIGI